MAHLTGGIAFNPSSPMLKDTFKDCDEGVLIRFWTDDSIFNLEKVQAKARTSIMLLYDLLFIDDCVLIANTMEDTKKCLTPSHASPSALDWL